MAEQIVLSGTGIAVPSNEGTESTVRVGQWTVGMSAYAVLTWLYDYVFFAAVIWRFGFIYGTIILTGLTAVLDFYCLRFYDSLKSDWLALEYLKSMKHYGGPILWKRLLGFVLRKTPLLIQIVVLTPYSNAFLTTALLRDGSYKYSTMTARDWKVFWMSFAFSQIYWISLVWLGVEGLTELYRVLMPHF